MTNWLLAAPEIFLAGMIAIILLIEVLVPQRQHRLTYALTQFSLFVTGLIILSLYQQAPQLVFNGGFRWDLITGILQLAIVIFTIFAFIYARTYIQARAIAQGEYYILGLFSVLGMLVLVSAHNLLTLYLGLELTSLPLYALVAIQRDNAGGAEAAMKYFVMGALASALFLYGLSMLYGATQQLQLDSIAQAVAGMPSDQQLIIVFGVILAIAGIAFKLGAAPFHMWVPDIYQGAPTAVTLFIGSAPKVAALGLAIRLLTEAAPALGSQWQHALILLAVISIALGNVVAITQSNLKRMLAYSAIAHIGYTLLGLLTVTAGGYAAALFYIIAYGIMSLGAFALLVLLSKAGYEAEHISDLRGLNTRNPWLAFMMLLVMFSMAGIPPSIGFFAKLGVLEALIRAHYVWLATYALVFAVIGAYYYLNVVKVMYFEEPEEMAPITITTTARVAISINGLGVLILGILPSGLIHLCHNAF